MVIVGFVDCNIDKRVFGDLNETLRKRKKILNDEALLMRCLSLHVL